MPFSILIPIGLMLAVAGVVLLVAKKQPKIAVALLGLGIVLVAGTIAVIGLATSSM